MSLKKYFMICGRIYIDWIKLGFGPSGKENYYMYKKFGVLPETEYEMEEIREVEKYVKDQE